MLDLLHELGLQLAERAVQRRDVEADDFAAEIAHVDRLQEGQRVRPWVREGGL